MYRRSTVNLLGSCSGPEDSPELSSSSALSSSPLSSSPSSTGVSSFFFFFLPVAVLLPVALRWLLFLVVVFDSVNVLELRFGGSLSVKVRCSDVLSVFRALRTDLLGGSLLAGRLLLRRRPAVRRQDAALDLICQNKSVTYRFAQRYCRRRRRYSYSHHWAWICPSLEASGWMRCGQRCGGVGGQESSDL